MGMRQGTGCGAAWLGALVAAACLIAWGAGPLAAVAAPLPLPEPRTGTPAATATGAAPPTATRQPAPLPTRAAPTASPAPLAGGQVFGAYIADAPWDPATIDAYAASVGAMPSVVMWYQDWAHADARGFDPAKMNAVTSRGATPMVTWEPWDYTGTAAQPTYSLAAIVAGNHDPFIRGWARDAAAWGRPFYLRFAPEMNGNWDAWGVGVNGNTAAQYIAAWRHVVDIFRQQGATNVRWVWCPNVQFEGSTPFALVYPGDAYVDWVGLDGYNWGTSQPNDPSKHWASLAEIFGASHDALAALTAKPMMIAEVASTEQGGDKAAWITQGLRTDLSARLPRVRLVIWFDEDKEADWRVASSPAALAAYRAAIAPPPTLPAPRR